MPTFTFSTKQRDALLRRFAGKIETNPDLVRKLVSYQEDKGTPFYRWFKYKEGFTSRLVQYLLKRVHPVPGVLLDPFVGSGSALFSAAALGWDTQGIEVLPVGVYAIEARIAANRVNTQSFVSEVNVLKTLNFASFTDNQYQLNHIAITKGAFPPATEQALIGYISYCRNHIIDENVRQLCLFASFCVLEDISFTRKDGQYLRWDTRSGRSQGRDPFNKGYIPTFAEAIHAKLDQMAQDLQFGRFLEPEVTNTPQVISGSSLEVLPGIESASVDVFLTSPPYCNRYDYTRTYALELVYLGMGHEDVTKLRQAMLSCTVENKTKRETMLAFYTSLGKKDSFNFVEKVFNSQPALHEVLDTLDYFRESGELNNPHIARLVRNYFYEICFIIFEMARILRPGGQVIMVNDNVRYAGEEVPVDLILSSMAESFGLITENIWTLGRGKGNSSQQMGIHGRSELRKCVYVWRKP